jgi:peptide chain release factor 1
VHTSTVTVAIMPEPTDAQLRLDERDLEISTTRDSGPGGQNRNKVETCVVIKYLPTGLMVRCASERSQHKNRQIALALLKAKVWEAQVEAEKKSLDASRKSQIGSGMRGDKRRTIRCQDGVVKDHVTNKEWRLKEYLRGDW